MDAPERYTATTTGRVVDRLTMKEVTKFGCSPAGIRAAMAHAVALNSAEGER